ncbi:hypothetical protein GCM10027034_30990 [Ramlibacter solisilvae]|uniref:Uncharacterized protein n=1 Tax=Ramlibacter tataouinensis TaxID=94132 RepID=A0A127JRJ7_9BURK|nr:hypothetical protein [Ramlibacter tataouinensis]AMO22654.1 hypothetical protein UC35_06870 [Ramlibacter tataouinensis]
MIANTISNARGVAVLSGGARVAAWSDASGVHAQRFDASGALVQGVVPVAASGTFSGVAALPAGGFVVEYQTPQAVFVQAVTAAGDPAGPASVVRTLAQVTLDYAGIPNANPVLVGGGGVYAFEDGSYAASYIVQHTATIPTDVPTALHAQKFDAGGAAVGGPVLLRDTAVVDDLASAAAPGSRLVAASMLTHSSGAGLQGATVFDSGLNPLFGVSLGQLGSSHTQPGVAGLVNGNFMALWTVQGVNQVQGQLFAADPSSPSGARAVSGLLTFPNAAPGARVMALAGGGFLVASGSTAQAFDANGQANSAVMQVQPGSVAATADGGFVVLAQVGSQLVSQQYPLVP